MLRNDSEPIDKSNRLQETQSSINLYDACPRKYFWQHVQKLGHDYCSYPMDCGNWFHDGMELFNNLCLENSECPSPEDFLQTFKQTFENHIAKNPENIEHHTECYHKAYAMLYGYMKRYDLNDTNIVSPELTFKIRMETPSGVVWDLLGKLDLLLRYDGKLAIKEYKTTSIVEDRRTAYQFGKQTNLYIHVAEVLTDERVSFFEYDLVNRVAARIEKGETEEAYQEKYIAACLKNTSGKSSLKRKIPETEENFIERMKKVYEDPKHFDRFSFAPDRQQIQEAIYEANRTVEEIHDLHINKAPREEYVKRTGNCFSYNRPCEYCDLCNAGKNWDDLRGIFQKVERHTELGEPVTSLVVSPI